MDNLFNDSDDQLDVEDNEDLNLEDYVGEGKKWVDPKQLLKGKLESDRFINNLQTELKELREELNSRLALAQMVDQLKQGKEARETSNPNPQDGGERDEQPQDVKKIVDELLAQRDSKSRVERNKELVKTKLTEQFGNGYNAQVKAKAQELGLTLNDMEELAANRPQVLLGLFKGNEQKVNTVVPQSQVNTAALVNRGTKIRDQAFYSALRKADPSKYFSPEVQKQKYQDAVQLGDRFYAT